MTPFFFNHGSHALSFGPGDRCDAGQIPIFLTRNLLLFGVDNGYYYLISAAVAGVLQPVADTTNRQSWGP